MSIKSFFRNLFGKKEAKEAEPVRVQPEFNEPAPPEPTPSRMTEEYKAWLQEQMEKSGDEQIRSELPEEALFADKLAAAKELLKAGGFSCVATDGRKVITSSGRGISPLLDMLDDGQDLSGFAVADKIVGRAAAFLFVRLKVSEVFGETVSRPALELLESYSVPASYDVLTDSIRNRAGTGLCPMETAVLDIEDPAEAEAKLRQTLAGLAQTSDDEKA